jgi:hypothetical protein
MGSVGGVGPDLWIPDSLWWRLVSRIIVAKLRPDQTTFDFHKVPANRAGVLGVVMIATEMENHGRRT